jgi:hypothetical protein
MIIGSADITWVGIEKHPNNAADITWVGIEKHPNNATAKAVNSILLFICPYLLLLNCL